MTSIRQDIIYGLRMLISQPAFTGIAVLSLALGIAVNSVIFSIINATILSPLGYEDEDRVVAIATHPIENPAARGIAGWREYEAWREAASFSSAGVLVPGGVRNLGATADGVGAAEELQIVRINPAMVETLGLRPQLGRFFTEEEDQIDNAAPVVLISDRFWERRFGRDPSAVGETLRLDGVPTTIIGVMPEGEEAKLLQPNADLWVPSAIVQAQAISDARFVVVFAHLAPGVSITEAQTELDAIARRMSEELPHSNENIGFRVMTVNDFIYNDTASLLFTLQGAVGFVLLIACANVAGLMLARATARQREIAVRNAIGAVRSRLVRQVLTESVVLSAAGGVVGVFFAWAGLRVFVSQAPPDVPNLGGMTINPEVLAFTGVVVFVTALLFGIVPAIQGTRPDLTALLNDSARGSSGGSARQRLRLVMVAGQTGLALVLLIAAGLMINSFAQLQGNDLGAGTEGILTFRVLFSQEEAIAFTGDQVDGVGLWTVNPLVGATVDQIYEQLRRVPGIESMAAVNIPPFNGALSRNFQIFGMTPEDGETPNANYIAVTPGYFETLDIELRRGRAIGEIDTEISPPVVVINESMAREFWEGEDPIGEVLTLDYVPGERPRQVVGIVEDVVVTQFQQEANPVMYVPMSQQTEYWRGPEWGARAATYFLARGRGEPLSLVADVQRAVAQVDPDRPVTQIRTIDQYLAEQMQGLTIIVGLLGTFGAIAGALAVSGIYGVVSYSVAQRTHEIGIRMSLGASGSSIFRLIMRQAVIVVLAGLVIGGVGAVALTRLIGNLLVGVSSTDPLTFAGVSLLLLAAALVACAVPTFRALRVDPSEALRYE